MSGYDAWLERPYVEREAQAAAEEAAWERFCDEHGLEYDDDSDEARRAFDAFLEQLEADAEAELEAAAEAMAEDRYW